MNSDRKKLQSSRSFLAPENRFFEPNRHNKTSFPQKASNQKSSFHSLLSDALQSKAKTTTSCSSNPIPSSKKSKHNTVKNSSTYKTSAVDSAPEEIEIAHQLRKPTLKKSSYTSSLAPLSDVKPTITSNGFQEAKTVWNPVKRETFSSQSWRQRSQLSYSGDIGGTPQISAPNPAASREMPLSHENELQTRKKILEPKAGEISTNFIRQNLKRRRGSYKSKQKSRDERSNPAALKRRRSAVENAVPYEHTSSSESDEQLQTAQASHGTEGSDGKGGLASFGLDSMQISLDALGCEKVVGATDTTFAKSSTESKAPVLSHEGRISVPRSDENPIFKVSYAESVCDELSLVTNSTNTASKRLGIREKISARRKDNGVLSKDNSSDKIEDYWLEKMAPKCFGHQMAAALLTVKKAGANKV